MKIYASLFLAIALLAGLGGCRRGNQSAQLQALEKAYKSGVFTKEEYDAKKQAILTPPPAAPAPAVAPAAPPSAPVPETPPPQAAAPPVVEQQPPAAPPPVSAPVPPSVAPAPKVPKQRAATPPPVQAPPPVPPAPRAVSAPPAPVPAPAEAAEPEPAPMAGCDDPEARRSGGPKGAQERFFPASMEAVHQATAVAFQNLDFTIHIDTAKDMEASKRRHIGAVIGAGGERLVLHFARASVNGQAGTRVTAETKKSFIGKLAQKSWTSAVLAQIGCNLHGRR